MGAFLEKVSDQTKPTVIPRIGVRRCPLVRVLGGDDVGAVRSFVRRVQGTPARSSGTPAEAGRVWRKGVVIFFES